MAAKFRAEGRSIDYTPGADVTAGDAFSIGGELIGIADNDIKANVKGALRISGMFEVPYTVGGGTAAVVTLGAANAFDMTTQKLVATTGNLKTFVVSAPDTVAETVWVLINYPG